MYFQMFIGIARTMFANLSNLVRSGKFLSQGQVMRIISLEDELALSHKQQEELNALVEEGDRLLTQGEIMYELLTLEVMTGFDDAFATAYQDTFWLGTLEDPDRQTRMYAVIVHSHLRTCWKDWQSSEAAAAAISQASLRALYMFRQRKHNPLLPLPTASALQAIVDILCQFPNALKEVSMRLSTKFQNLLLKLFVIGDITMDRAGHRLGIGIEVF